METSAMPSPLRLNARCEVLRRYPNSPESAEVLPPPEPNFRIDDLLDFSNSELCDDEALSDGGEEGAKDGNSTCGNDTIEPKEEISASKGEDACTKAATSGLCVPSDELADQLEWLSAFNEDSSYSGDRHLASLVRSGCFGGPKDDEKPATLQASKFRSPSPISVLEPSSIHTYPYTLSTSSSSSSQHIPSRARSKRVRAGARIWSSDSLMPTLFDTRACGATAQESPVFFGLPSSNRHETFVPSKKVKKPDIIFKPVAEAPPRRCTHCLVQKTPQWRAGPMGPKTLCNACGVRYKSGRLVPEYRPAGSPTFMSEVHSNSHKRILEMRRVKEMEEEHIGGGKERPQEDEDSDCLSQSESSKEERRKEENARSRSSQEDLNGSICSEKGDGMGSICSEKEDPAGSICIENTDSMGLVCSGELDAAAPKRLQMTLLI